MTDTVKNIIDKFELGYVFTVSDFPLTAENAKTISKILNDFPELWENLRSTY